MIYVLIRARTKFEWLVQAVQSVLNQTGPDFKILLVDDASDYTREQKSTIQHLLKKHIALFNEERKYSIRNAYELISEYAVEDGIVINVDGDDFLTSPNVFNRINRCYQQSNCLLAYGECQVIWPHWTWKSFLPSKHVFTQHNTRYPPKIEIENAYRLDPIFRPLHPRSWKVSLFNQINPHDFLDDQGNWLKTCEDQAMFFPMLEMAGGRYFVDNKILYGYRWDHAQTDHRIRPNIQSQEEYFIRNKPRYNCIYG